MLRLPEFTLRRAHSVAEACAILAGEEGLTRPVAGGTDLWPNMKRRHQRADTVVSLGPIEELRGVRGEVGAEMRVGATTTLAAIVADPTLRRSHPAFVCAVQSISSPVLRNTGTIGGNLCLDTRCTYYNQNEEWRRSIDYCMKEQGATCWVAPGSPRCWAVSSSDAAPMLCALGARVRLASSEGERVIDLAELYRDDGIDYLTKRHDELLVEVLVPPTDGARTAFWKLRRRGSIDFGVLSTAVCLRVGDDGAVTDASIYLGCVASLPVRAREAEELLVGGPLDVERIAIAAAAARKAGTPMNNTDFVPQWRGKMIEKYLEAALREAAGLEAERLAPRHGFGVGWWRGVALRRHGRHE